MKQKFQTLKGFRDILPEDAEKLRILEDTARRVFSLHNCVEIMLPVLEKTELFIKSIGETTDIVEKEMFVFEDKDGERVALRPEGTASVARAYIENGIYVSSPKIKLFYSGPMFRRERPQKGRFRQFYQIGMEYFGVREPLADAEVISLLLEIYKGAGINDVKVRINTLGCKNCRVNYLPRLKAFLDKYLNDLCEDCRRRKEVNPLRFFDCKRESADLKSKAPHVEDELCGECREHYKLLDDYLQGLPVEHDPSLVRGLDYYTRTVFELFVESEGRDFALAAGGRYDELVESFGGPSTPAVGFAIGCERTIQLMRAPEKRVDIFIVGVGSKYAKIILETANKIHRAGVSCDFDASLGSVKSQMRRADKLKSKFVLFLGEDEIKKGVFKVRDMTTGKEHLLNENAFHDFIMKLKNKENQESP